MHFYTSKNSDSHPGAHFSLFMSRHLHRLTRQPQCSIEVILFAWFLESLTATLKMSLKTRLRVQRILFPANNNTKTYFFPALGKTRLVSYHSRVLHILFLQFTFIWEVAFQSARSIRRKLK